jgi:glutamate synthase domain-containing protein 1
MTTSSTHGASAVRREGLYDPSYEHDGCGIGFVAHVKGERSPQIVSGALELLENLAHRSAVAADSETGDGAGMLVQIPHAFLWRACRHIGVSLPEAGAYGVGMIFLPPNDDQRAHAEGTIERVVADRGCRVLGWRDVPIDERHCGASARATRPAIRQLFVTPMGMSLNVDDASTFERTLYVMRRQIERVSREAARDGEPPIYVASLSSRTLVYKGMLRPTQLRHFYPDLVEPDFASALALVHSRFSTNTFPSWPLAHPYRYVCHNGEINTLRGNLTWMRVREASMASDHFARDLAELIPVVSEGQSDSASFDNVLELLVQAGRPLAHAMMMLIPEAWEGDETMSAERRAFYEYHSAIVEPWDGPAAMAFTDGRQIGAVLDRNGLRPARYVVTNDDVIVLASEAGALPSCKSRSRRARSLVKAVSFPATR